MGCGLTQAGYDGTGARKKRRAIVQSEEETVQIIEDKVYAFSKDNPPCYTAQPGEVLQFNTLDCFSGRLTDETVTMKDMDFSYNITNPAAGPVYVEGAEVGDVLVVDIYDIQVADEGTITPTDDHCGPLFKGTDYRTKKIKIEGGMADFNGVRFPINPMIGVIGTAPAKGAPADGFVGNYGGNMDNKLITKGTRLYFPVRVPGALLQMGDVHATMGDAELCGTGIEIAAQITVRVNVLKNFELHWPVLETFGPAGKWYVNASAQEYNEALICASKEMQRLLMNITGWDAVETYMYMSVQSDVEISQGCKPCEVQLSLRIGTPKLTEFPPLVGRSPARAAAAPRCRHRRHRSAREAAWEGGFFFLVSAPSPLAEYGPLTLHNAVQNGKLWPRKSAGKGNRPTRVGRDHGPHDSRGEDLEGIERRRLCHNPSKSRLSASARTSRRSATSRS